MTMGERIKKRRIELDLTQQELASLVGYKTRGAINKIEAGKHSLTPAKIAMFARALNTTSAKLLGLTEIPKLCSVSYKENDVNNENPIYSFSSTTHIPSDLLFDNLEDCVYFQIGSTGYILDISKRKFEPDSANDYSVVNTESGVISIVNATSVVEKYTSNLRIIGQVIAIEKKQPINETYEPSESEKMLLDLFRKIPEDKQSAFIDILRAALKTL